MQRFIVSSLVILGVLAATVPALATNTGAEGFKALGSFKMDLDFRMQAQIDVLGVMAVPDPVAFGGLELHANGSFAGLTLAASLGYERLSGRNAPEGAYLGLGFQLRPLALADVAAYRWIDPHIGIGGRFGGIGDRDDIWFRATLALSAGIDIRLADSDPHPVLNIQYRFEPVRYPNVGDQHLIVFGFGMRTIPD